MTTQTRLVPILGTDNASRIGDVVFVHGLGGDALSTWHPQGKAVPNSQAYQLHSLIAQYCRAKLEERAEAKEFKQKFCGVMNQIAGIISETSTLVEIQALDIAIPHLSNVATSLNNLAELYRLQGRYEDAEPFHLQALE